MMTYLAVILGDAASGKSSLRSRCIDNSFDEDQPRTIGGEFYIRANPSIDEASRLKLLDTSGDIQYKHVLSSYYSGAKICIYCVDLTKPFNRDAIIHEIDEFKDRAPDAAIIVVGTKSDLELETTEEELMQFTQEQQYQGTFITSAKNDINIRELMIAVDAVAKKENESKVVGVAIERMAEVVASVDKDAPLHASLSELEKTIAALDPSQREKIGIQAGVLLSNLQNLQNTGAIIPAIELFKRNCEAVVIVSGDKSAPSFLLKNVLKAIAIVAIVALVTVVAAVVGFGIGFVLGNFDVVENRHICR